MSGSPDPFSGPFSLSFGSGAVAGWFSLPVTAQTEILVSGLNAGTTYAFRVYAINAEGAGPPSPVLTLEV